MLNYKFNEWFLQDRCLLMLFLRTIFLVLEKLSWRLYSNLSHFSILISSSFSNMLSLLFLILLWTLYCSLEFLNIDLSFLLILVVCDLFFYSFSIMFEMLISVSITLWWSPVFKRSLNLDSLLLLVYVLMLKP